MNSKYQYTFRLHGGPRYFVNSRECSKGSKGGKQIRFTLSTNDRDMPDRARVKITSSEVRHLLSLDEASAAAICSTWLKEYNRPTR